MGNYSPRYFDERPKTKEIRHSSVTRRYPLKAIIKNSSFLNRTLDNHNLNDHTHANFDVSNIAKTETSPRIVRFVELASPFLTAVN